MNPAEKPWYRIDNSEEIDSPALVFYKDRIRTNIRHAVRRVKDRTLLRPHVKTNKSADICAMMMQEGITKFKCATIAEAEMLASIGAPDVLLAYQPVGPKIDRLIALSRRFPSTRFSCLIDNAFSAQAIAAACHSAGRAIDVYMDINVGQNRTGIVADDAFDLFGAISSKSGMTVAGLHAYDGHITDTEPTLRTQRCNAAFDGVFQLQQKIGDRFSVFLPIVAGGSPTFSIHADHGGVECSPGTFVLWDWSYQSAYPDEPYEIAALVLARVVSVVNATTICIDLGHKSIASEHPLPRVYFINAPDATPAGHSEEHMIVTVPNASQYTIGDVLYGVPVHICPTVSMYETASVVEHHSMTAQWNITARNRRITI